MKLCRELETELTAYREGGLTEEILRRNDGYIKVGKGCVIALASTIPPNDQGHLSQPGAGPQPEIKP